MKRQRVAVAGVGFAGLVVVAMTSVGHIAAAATPNPHPPRDLGPDRRHGVRAASRHGISRQHGHRRDPAAGVPSGQVRGVEQPKPYFLSYAVSDSDSIAMSAQFGAIVGSNESRRRIADVQVRLGTAAEDNTHGDHRNSALTTVPLPLTDDGASSRAQPLVRHQPRLRAKRSTAI